VVLQTLGDILSIINKYKLLLMRCMGRKGIYLIIFILIITQLVSAQVSEQDKVYFTTQQEKLVAQFSAKLESNTVKIGNDMKAQVDSAKNDIQNTIQSEIRSTAISIVIGLGGIMIIILGIFQLIHLKVTSTRNIKKYEKILQDQAAEFKLILDKAKIEREQLTFARIQLLEFQKNLNLWHTNLQHTTANMLSHGELPDEYKHLVKSPKIQVVKKPVVIKWSKIVKIGLIVLIIVTIIAGIVKIFVLR
jgi:hypothetical protein